jgi:hypothetical protein
MLSDAFRDIVALYSDPTSGRTQREALGGTRTARSTPALAALPPGSSSALMFSAELTLA